jgi:glucans biosynthesis protein
MVVMSTTVVLGNRCLCRCAGSLARHLIVGLLCVVWASAAASSSMAQTSHPAALSLESLREQARRIAASPYVEPDTSLPESLESLNYDTYRLIRYRRDQAVWAQEGLPFQLQFAHRGYIFPLRVEMNLIQGGRLTPVPFSTDLFEYGGSIKAEALPKDLGFAGFRVLYSLNAPHRFDELISFLGSSYFRALGRDQVYGASARGLAIDTRFEKEEEFPWFSAFWIERPPADGRSITLFALLQSRSVAGAYQFTVRPGENTLIETEASLFPRRSVRALGLAPLTSMFLFDENTAGRFKDRRPRVHDSDGLLLANGDGEWIWRPLRNPPRMSVSQYALRNPRGFGLMQRERRSDRYRDAEAIYERRPNVWVEPTGDWGAGAVELIEWPSNREGYDNVAASWVPVQSCPPGQELRLRYRLQFRMTDPPGNGGGRCAATQWKPHERGARIQVDFQNLPLADAKASPEAAVTASHGGVREVSVGPTMAGGGWSVSFDVTPDPGRPTELRAFLRSGNDTLTETWSYQWQPSN